jgi:hypothetical protein
VTSQRVYKHACARVPVDQFLKAEEACDVNGPLPKGRAYDLNRTAGGFSANVLKHVLAE